MHSTKKKIYLMWCVCVQYMPCGKREKIFLWNFKGEIRNAHTRRVHPLIKELKIVKNALVSGYC